MTITHPKLSAVPVRFLQSLKFTDCMPSGSTILSASPAEGDKEREEDKVRNEEASAAGTFLSEIYAQRLTKIGIINYSYSRNNHVKLKAHQQTSCIPQN